MASAFDISGSGLTAERLRMDVIANNIANVDSTRTPQGGPYKREMVVFAPRQESFSDILSSVQGGQPQLGGVQVVGITEDNSPPRMLYDPGNPDANKQGMVAYPNVNTVTEMVDLIDASRAYQANVTAMTETKNMENAAATIASV